MLEWLTQNAQAIQAIAAVVSVALTIFAIVLTLLYVVVTKDIAETTHRQLSAVLQPMILIDFKSVGGGVSTMGDTGETNYFCNLSSGDKQYW